MQVTIPFEYTVRRIPPRCRKEREFIERGSVIVDIPNVSTSAAPVALIEHGVGYFGDKFTREYRWFDHRLWTLPFLQRDPAKAPENRTLGEFLDKPTSFAGSAGRYKSFEENRNTLRERCEDILFIEQILWSPIGEPYYEVVGHHTGDRIKVDWRYAGDRLSNWFRIDQLDDALGEASTGDRKPEHFSRFEILIPEVLQMPRRAPKEDFTVTVSLKVTARGQAEAVRQFASDSGLHGFGLSNLDYVVVNEQSREFWNLKYK